MASIGIIDEREVAKKMTFEMTIKVKKSLLVRCGLVIIMIGCWVGGFGYKEAKE